MARQRTRSLRFRSPLAVRLACCFACVTMAVPAASAQPDTTMPVEERRADDPYGDVLRQAVAAYKAEQWPLARQLFETVHAKAPTARTARSIGLVDFRQGRYVEAVSMLEASLASNTLPLTKELRDSTELVLQEAKSYVGQVVVQSEPMPTRIEIEGQPAVRDAEGAVLLLPGSHRLTLTFTSESAEVSHDVPVQVVAGQREVLRLSAQSAQNVVPTPLDSSSNAANLAAPSAAAQSLAVDSPVYPRRLALGWTLLGTSLVSLGVGTYFGVSSLQTYNRAERACPTHASCSSDALDERDLAQRRAWVADATLAAGAVLGIVGGTLLIIEARGPARKREAEARTKHAVGSGRVTAALRPAWRGVVLEGRF